MVDSWAASRVRERVERACLSSLDSRELRLEVLSLVGSCVGFDAYAWPLTDPVTAVGGAPLADVPCLPELATLIRLKYLSRINRWTDLAESGRRVQTLVRATGGDLSRSSLFRGILNRHSIMDTASVVFADGYGCWGFLDLWRSRPGRGNFGESEVALLAGIAPAVTAALRLRQARACAPPAGRLSPAEVEATRPAGPAIVTLDDTLRLLARTGAAESLLARLQPAEPGAAPVPAAVYNVAAQLLAVEAGVDARPALARWPAGEYGMVTIRAGRLLAEPASDTPMAASATGPAGPPGIVVTIEPTAGPYRLELFARAHALTARESQLLRLVSGGDDTRAIAKSMSISANTVQEHLKSMFVKTGTDSRLQLLSAALGTGWPAAG